jgi:hypothetical protein
MHSDEAVIHMCNTWRVEHPAIVQFWDNLNDAAITAMTPGCDGAFVKRSNISFARVDEWLSMILPNDKRIWYFDLSFLNGINRKKRKSVGMEPVAARLGRPLHIWLRKRGSGKG